MDVRELVRSILDGDLLTARQWVSDAQREHLVWNAIPRPTGLNSKELTVAAAILEMLADRSGDQPPSWTASIGATQEPMILDPGLETMPRSFAQAKIDAPGPLRRRNLLALPGFLDVA
jgi:hypothetical protein